MVVFVTFLCFLFEVMLAFEINYNFTNHSLLQEESLEKKMSGCNLEDFSEGLIGKLIVRKSGRVQMMLGQTLLDVEMGTPCGFLQVSFIR